MGNMAQRLAKVLVAACAAGAFFSAAFGLIVPKFVRANTVWTTTSTFRNFYGMERNTIDVLCFGSSHAATSFVPQELYRRRNVRAYNLGSEQQSLVTTYWWLREALRFQSPSAVLLDCYLLFPYNRGEPLNAAESMTRKAFDSMRWSAVKAMAARDLERHDKKLSAWSFVLPNIRYHERVKHLAPEDFIAGRLTKNDRLKGYAPLLYPSNIAFSPIADGGGEEEPMVPLMEEYLEKIAGLCAERGIALVLYKIPTVAWNAGRHNRVARFAEERGLPFIDFNREDLHSALRFDFARDMADGGHASFWGARKISRHLADVLWREHGAGGVIDAQWERTEAAYRDLERDALLRAETDRLAYISLLRTGGERYSVFMSLWPDGVNGLPEDIEEAFQVSGTEESWKRGGYVEVITAKKTQSRAAQDEPAECRAALNRGSLRVELKSAGLEAGDRSEIVLNGQNVSKNRRGLNIVVYDNGSHSVVDSVCLPFGERTILR